MLTMLTTTATARTAKYRFKKITEITTLSIITCLRMRSALLLSPELLSLLPIGSQLIIGGPLFRVF
jgi:hypothetical protein